MTLSWARSAPEDLRAQYRQDAAALVGTLPPDVVETVLPERDSFRGGLLFAPASRPARTIVVYFHGGGFIVGAPETHRGLTAWLSSLAGLPVLSARYGLAPERPFPAQRDDAVAAVEAAVLNGASDIILAGDSAGACVALWALRALPAELRKRIRGLVLIYGGFGLLESGSVARYGNADDGLDADTLAVMYGRLRLGPPDHPDWPRNFVAEIAEPAYVLAAERDALFDDSHRFFQAIRGRHALSRFVVAEAQEHGFMKAAGPDPAARRELQAIAGWIRDLGIDRRPDTTNA